MSWSTIVEDHKEEPLRSNLPTKPKFDKYFKKLISVSVLVGKTRLRFQATQIRFMETL